MVFVFIPRMAQSRQKAQMIRCVSFHKQIGLSFRMWATDSSSCYPFMVSTNRSGTLEVSNEVWRTMLSMSNELNTPKILACPSDNRQPAASWASLANSNISNFIGLDGDEATPEVILCGDRFLSTGRPTTNQVLVITTNDSPDWASNNHQGSGNLAYSDGSVQQFSRAKMQQAVKISLELKLERNTNATLRLAMPE
jgi:prepilin-type processing-associated H-X9-DG protein